MHHSPPQIPTVAVLFARSDSVYHCIPGTDVWDADRDALTWPGGCPVVCHPPCRSWGRLRHFAKPRPDERDLAIFAVRQVRAWGGVLEHPASSTLWRCAGLPSAGVIDFAGGFTLPVPQWWWGHRANKASWLYIVGVTPRQLPPMPYRLGEATHVVSSSHGIHPGHPRFRPHLSKAEREATPLEFAKWLVDAARLCRRRSTSIADG